jgi:hypothetical protein
LRRSSGASTSSRTSRWRGGSFARSSRPVATPSPKSSDACGPRSRTCRTRSTC